LNEKNTRPFNNKPEIMKNILLIFVFLFVAIQSFGQRTELSIRLNSGLSNFSGEFTKETTLMTYSLVDENGHVESSYYAALYGPVYGLSLNLSRVLDSRLKFGAELGFELLKSKMEIDQVFQHGSSAENSIFDAEGQVYINSGFVNLFPNVGYRILFEDFYVDIDVGVVLGYNLLTDEKGSAETELREYKTTDDRKTIDLDMRPRAQIGITFNNVGGYVGYSKGLTNYLKDNVGGSEGAYQDVIRAGVYYTIKLKGRDYLKFRRR
jgi:hypothetical protein